MQVFKATACSESWWRSMAFEDCCWSIMLLLLAILFQLSQAQLQPAAELNISFTESPPSASSSSIAHFQFVLTGNTRGVDPCLSLSCSILCKVSVFFSFGFVSILFLALAMQLDGGPSVDCSSRRLSYTALADGNHTFEVGVNISNGNVFSAARSWTVDTVPPTATLLPRTAFTNGFAVTLDIVFSEPCYVPREFSCYNQSFCDLMLRGPGMVVPATLMVLRPRLEYSMQVTLSNQPDEGRIVLALARTICSDAAGNSFRRSSSSSTIVRFDRNPAFVNMWTPISATQVFINNLSRTVWATNKLSDLRINLDFNEPVVNTTDELLASLSTTAGLLSPAPRRNHGNRRFAFKLTNVSGTTLITLSLDSTRVMSRAQSPVQPVKPIVFMFDEVRPRVRLTTAGRTSTRRDLAPVLVEFSKPVQFFSSDINVLGGTILSFKEVSTTTYFAEVAIASRGVLSVFVQENQTADVTGNKNFASNVLRLRHYEVPVTSVAISSFTSVGLLVTALASGALSISSATLAAAGALPSRTASSIVTDPSQNFLGMVSHIQVFAFSGWLAVSLPTIFFEATRGLTWLVPSARVPWDAERDETLPTTFALDTSSSTLSVAQTLLHRRKLESDSPIFGPPLSSKEYQLYFQQRSSIGQTLDDFLRHDKGWKAFWKNVFWMTSLGGLLVLLHLILLQFLRWRTKTSMKGSLSIPRFELFVMFLALPCISQASLFILRGGTTLGIIIGVLLLALPAAFLLCVFVFLLLGVIFELFVQYKVVATGKDKPTCCNRILTSIAGRRTIGRWVRQDGFSSRLLPKYGLLFEALKGPPYIVSAGDHYKWVVSGSNGIGRMKPDDQPEPGPVSRIRNFVGAMQCLYILVEHTRRIALGIIFGSGYHPTRQLILLLVFTVLQLVYLVLFKPYIRRSVQIVETLSLVCEAGLFLSALLFLRHSQPSAPNTQVGVAMIVLLLTCFGAQMYNEWYALVGLVLKLAPAEAGSFKLGMKMLVRGLLLPFIPRSKWSRLVTPFMQQPSTGFMHQVAASSPEDAAIRSLSAEPPHPQMAREQAWQRHPLERKRSEKAKDYIRTTDEWSMLQELARASFPNAKKPPEEEFFSPPTRSARIEQQHGKEKMLELSSQDNSSDDTSWNSISAIVKHSSPQAGSILRRVPSSGRMLMDER